MSEFSPLKSVPDVPVRMLFYDALSGDFLPPSDVLKRRHTLGRLMFGTISKGERQWDHRSVNRNVPYELAGRLNAYTYRPDWADVEATALCATLGTGYAVGLELSAGEGGSELAVYDVSAINKQGISIVTSEVTRMPLELSDKLDKTRAFVSQVAQTFFDAIPAL